jgi:hypothetical protein
MLCAAGSCTAARLPSRAFKDEVIDQLIPQRDEVRHVYIHAMCFGSELYSIVCALGQPTPMVMGI